METCEANRARAPSRPVKAVRFLDKNVDGLALGIEKELLDANSFSEVVRGYTSGIVPPYMMHGFPVSAIRVSLVIVASLQGSPPNDGDRLRLCAP